MADVYVEARCSAAGCDHAPKAKGLCNMHLKRLSRSGTLDRVKGTRRCDVEGCEGRHYGQGLCRMHWKRRRRLGTLELPDRSAEQRFWDFVDKDNGPVGVLGQCWLWTGALRRGYGAFSYDGTGQTGIAHRFAYLTFVGEIPEGWTVDHVCHSVDPECRKAAACPHRRCVNPQHLQAVPRPENVSRSARRLTRCKRGHEFTPDNTRLDKRGRRCCRACAAIWSHENRRAKGVPPRVRRRTRIY